MPCKTQTKLMAAVCKRAGLMRAKYRVSSYPTAQTSQKKTNLLSNKNKQQSLPIVKSSEEKTERRVGAYQFTKYQTLINVITHVQGIHSKMTVI